MYFVLFSTYQSLRASAAAATATTPAAIPACSHQPPLAGGAAAAAGPAVSRVRSRASSVRHSSAVSAGIASAPALPANHDAGGDKQGDGAAEEGNDDEEEEEEEDDDDDDGLPPFRVWSVSAQAADGFTTIKFFGFEEMPE